MMKKYIFFFATLFSEFVFAQKILKVEYEMTKSVNLSNMAMSDEIKAKLMEQLNKPESYTLYYYKGNSFYTNGTAKIQELDNKETKVNESSTKKTVVSFKPSVARFYKTAGEKRVFVYHQYQGEEFYEIFKPSWKQVEYKDDTQRIDNFDCKLVEVTTDQGKMVKIWYTEQIPISIGPSWYQNFPGLVMKVEASDFMIYATKVSNDAKESDVEKVDSKLKVYEGKEWEAKYLEMKKQRKTPTVIRRSVQM